MSFFESNITSKSSGPHITNTGDKVFRRKDKPAIPLLTLTWISANLWHLGHNVIKFEG